MSESEPRAEAAAPSAVAHELNNLLAGSMQTVASAANELQGLGQGGPDDPSTDRVLRRLDSAEQLMRRMAELVEVLGQSQPINAELAADSVLFTTRTQTLGEAIDEALNGIEAEATQAGVTLDALVDPRLAAMPADAIYTVLSNGLRNSLEAIHHRQTTEQSSDCIELRLTRDGGDGVLTITDTGPGVDPELRTPGGGFRFGVTTKPEGHGVGLGLCRQVAMALGGKLWLRDALPSGAVLTLRFPVASLDGRVQRSAG
ncbi:MAG: ATP-binding protein [Planctomycetota bacterium]